MPLCNRSSRSGKKRNHLPGRACKQALLMPLQDRFLCSELSRRKDHPAKATRTAERGGREKGGERGLGEQVEVEGGERGGGGEFARVHVCLWVC